MPYVDTDSRIRLEALTEEISKSCITGAGDLNYAFSLLCKRYLDINGVRYQYVNDIVGALEGAKLEFYRRIAAPYEDTKIESNGDVY